MDSHCLHQSWQKQSGLRPVKHLTWRQQRFTQSCVLVHLQVSARIIYLGYKPGDYMHLLTSYVVDNLADTYFYRTVTR